MGPTQAQNAVLYDGRNTPDACLPSKLLMVAWQKAVAGDKSAKVPLEQCHAIAAEIKDTSITPLYVQTYCAKQRAIHLCRKNGAQKAIITRRRRAACRVGGAVVDGQVEHAVEELLEKRWDEEEGIAEYLTKWKNFSTRHNTWEAYSVVGQCQAMEEYAQAHGSQPGDHPSLRQTRITFTGRPQPGGRAAVDSNR